MNVQPEELRKSGTSPVSKYFRRDWQFIVDYVRMPIAKEAATILVATPAVLELDVIKTILGGSVSKTIGLTWLAAFTYVIFVLVGYFVCPKFVREYRDFGEYSKREHSNRFIGWELQNALRLTKDDKLIDELIEKGLVKKVAEEDVKRIVATGLSSEDIGRYKVYGPNNVGVNLHTYFRTGYDMYSLTIDDTCVDEHSTFQRNLFWVIYTKLAKLWPKRRYLVWSLFNLSIFLGLASVLANFYRTIFG